MSHRQPPHDDSSYSSSEESDGSTAERRIIQGERENSNRKRRLQHAQSSEDDDNDTKNTIPSTPSTQSTSAVSAQAAVTNAGTGSAAECTSRPLCDWYCHCGALNFRRRNSCHRQNCNVTRTQATGLATVGAGVTRRLALSGLDIRSGEQAVVRALQVSAPPAAARLAAVALGPQGSGVCYLTYSTVNEAMDAYSALLAARLQINGCKVSVAYQPEVWGHPAAVPPPVTAVSVPAKAQPAPAFTANDIPRMAAYSAQLYAKSPQEQAQYLQYYTSYYSSRLTAPPTEADRVNAAAAVAQSAITQLHARGSRAFAEDRIYPTPDTSVYVYDDSSGYYYDPSTGLYYDPTTQYYYDGQTGQYLYWNAAKMTYTAAATVAASAPAPAEEPPAADLDSPDKKKPKEKRDKIEVAKRIAKDMERWAKTQNQKKDLAKNIARAEAAEAAEIKSSGCADIGYSVLESRNATAVPVPGPAVAPSCGDGSESSGEDEEETVDLKKLACLLCKRQFPSRDVLEKHLKLSDLHRQNFEEFQKRKALEAEEDERDEIMYRDRAAERRLKFGIEGPPVAKKKSKRKRKTPRMFKESKLATLSSDGASSTNRELGVENVGNRLMQKMGWSAGQGLGREGQGRVAPLEAKSGPKGVGLGQKKGIYTAGPGETYQDCVRKLTIARYQELMESEENP